GDATGQGEDGGPRAAEAGEPGHGERPAERGEPGRAGADGERHARVGDQPAPAAAGDVGQGRGDQGAQGQHGRCRDEGEQPAAAGLGNGPRRPGSPGTASGQRGAAGQGAPGSTASGTPGPATSRRQLPPGTSARAAVTRGPRASTGGAAMRASSQRRRGTAGA